jgi:hypothetical protein
MTRSFRRFLSALLLTAAAVVPGRALAVTQNYCSFPAPLTTWTLNQNAFEALNSEIRLTDANTTSEAGSAFLTAPVAITATTSFHAYFRFQMGPSAAGGDGLAFVVHNSAQGAAAIGGIGGAMGYGGITPSVVVEFDTFKNGASDPSANHVGLMLNGANTTHTASATPAFTMAGPGVLYAWVDYDGVGKTITVYLSQTATKPGAALFTHALNLFVQLGSGGQMFIGFTGGTGAAVAETNEHDVLELEFSTDGVPCTCEGDTACGGATPACAASGLCAVCSATNKTACTGATPVCNVPMNVCVGCLKNSDCSGATPICDTGTLACRACATNADCGGSTPACATTGPNTGQCVDCVADANCPPATPRCNPTNTCVQCLSGMDCGGDTPVCNASKCSACASDADCSGTTPACEVWGACGQCSSTNANQCMGGTSVCDYPTGDVRGVRVQCGLQRADPDLRHDHAHVRPLHDERGLRRQPQRPRVRDERHEGGRVRHLPSGLGLHEHGRAEVRHGREPLRRVPHERRLQWVDTRVQHRLQHLRRVPHERGLLGRDADLRHVELDVQALPERLRDDEPGAALVPDGGGAGLSAHGHAARRPMRDVLGVEQHGVLVAGGDPGVHPRVGDLRLREGQ